jgi:hypothetical protein
MYNEAIYQTWRDLGIHTRMIQGDQGCSIRMNLIHNNSTINVSVDAQSVEHPKEGSGV